MDKPIILSLESLLRSPANDGQEMESGAFYHNEGMAVVFGRNQLMQAYLRPQSPYLIDDYRCGLVVSGTLRGRINLVEHSLTAGTLVYLGPGSFVEPLDATPDFRICGLGMVPDVFGQACATDPPAIFTNALPKDGQLPLTDDELPLMRTLFATLWQMLHQPTPTSRPTRHAMAAALMHQVSDLFTRHQPPTQASKGTGHALFERFLQLVNAHATTQRRLAFYADHLCVTERYLTTTIRQASGLTAKHWIDRAVITAAKVMLRHSDLPVNLIADELQFPNPSFFCKYFRRLTGTTPQAYRDGQ